MRGRDWLDHHLETFVRPKLGSIPDVNPNNPGDYHLVTWNKTRIEHLQLIWEQAKKRSHGRPILLAGRDVFLLEMLARLEDYPTTFRSDISSTTKSIVKEDYSEFYMVDTGYKGTVPRALKMKYWDLIDFRTHPDGKLPTWDEYGAHQLFPRMEGNHPIRAVAGILEGCLKYWNQATISQGTHKKESYIVQTFVTNEYFTKAAQITLLVARTILHPKPSMSFGRFL